MKPSLPEFKTGRRFAGPLPPGADLITSIEGMCKEGSIRMASFRVWGAVSSFTIGTYDQVQQVFITHFQAAPREIVSCTGTVSLQDGQPQVNAQLALSDDGLELTYHYDTKQEHTGITALLSALSAAGIRFNDP